MTALSQCTEQKYTRKIQLQKMEARTLLGTKERFALFELKMQCLLNLTYEAKKKKTGYRKTLKSSETNRLKSA